ncbi:MAG: hypothetical protein ACLS3M_06815 [Collinsella sp.]
MLKFLNALAALATVGTFIIAFLNSYEVRIKVRRRTRGQTVSGICAASANKNAGVGSRHLTKPENWAPALLDAYTGCVVFTFILSSLADKTTVRWALIEFIHRPCGVIATVGAVQDSSSYIE